MHKPESLANYLSRKHHLCSVSNCYPQFSEKTKDRVFKLIAHSRGKLISGINYRSIVDKMFYQLKQLGVEEIFIHNDYPARLAAAMVGAHAFCHKIHIYLGPTIDTDLGPSLKHVLEHELVHIAQVRRGIQTGQISELAMVEKEAHLFPESENVLSDLKQGASPNEIYCLWWLLPLAAAAYVMLRPNVANAPGPGDVTYPSVSELQVAGEAFALFYIPGAAYGIGGRLGLGFIGSSALSGASLTTSFRGVQDLGLGNFSGAQAYIYDAATGAVIGVVTAGGIYLLGKAGTVSLDWLATHGMRRSDLAVTRIIAERAASNPLSQGEVATLMQSRSVGGRISEWWLNRRGLVILWRGQGQATTQILSPLARENGIAASEVMVARMRAAGITNNEIAGYTASWYTQPVPSQFTLPQLSNLRLGAAGIPATRLPGVASNFGNNGIVYVIRLPNTAAIKVPQWGLAVENEWVILNQVPKGSVVGYVQPSKIPSLEINEAGQLILAR